MKEVEFNQQLYYNLSRPELTLVLFTFLGNKSHRVDAAILFVMVYLQAAKFNKKYHFRAKTI